MSVLARRLTSQLLAGPPARSAAAVCERLLAVQAQDALGARLAVRARTRGLTVADFERALNDREIVIGWLNRGTLHLVRGEDYFWLHALTTPRLLTASTTRLAQLGVDADAAERWVAVIAAALESRGPMTRRELGELGAPREALLHLLFRASLRGLLLRGPMRGKQHCYVLTRDWLGEPPAVDREAALRELGVRFLAGHSPADDRDLAKWAGIPLSAARQALREAAPPRRRTAPLPAPRLLGAFEPMLLGWTSRQLFVGPHEPSLVAGGMFLPLMMAGGRAVGTWRMPAGRLVLTPFEDLTPEEAGAFAADSEDLRRLLAGEPN